MANCPNCGSTHIQLKRETNVNWGRAITGLALFGVVGGAVGAVTGEDRNTNACLDCGTSWKAEDLYKILQLIKKSTDINPDMTTRIDRSFVNNFISEITPYIEAMSTAEKEAEKIVKDSENNKAQFEAAGCSWGCMLTLALGFASGFTGSLLFLMIPIVGLCIGKLMDTANRQYIEKQIKNSKREATRMNTKAENNFKRKVEKLADSYFMSYSASRPGEIRFKRYELW
jgi:hypothetical protein